jgi:hypothetical protein
VASVEEMASRFIGNYCGTAQTKNPACKAKPGLCAALAVFVQSVAAHRARKLVLT